MAKKGHHKKKKMGISNTVIAPLEDDLPEQPTDLVVPELEEYAQVAECPYTTPIITLKVDGNYYRIPQQYLQPYKTLQFEPEVMHNEYWGSERHHHHQLCIEPQSAHTFIHYLYTGQYETLKTPLSIPQSAEDIPTILNTRDREEFQRAAYVYQAAVRYEIPGLLSMAQHFMARFAERLSIDDILRAIRRVYGSLLAESSGHMWLEDFVRDQLDVAFINTDGKLRQIMRGYEVGNSGSFDKFLFDEVLALYEREQDRIHHMKSFASSRGYHEPVPDAIPESDCEPEPACEPACEPELDLPCYDACDHEPLFEPIEEEPRQPSTPEPEPEQAEPTPEPEFIAPGIPYHPLYSDWDELGYKARKQREEALIRMGHPIPGKDFELPLPECAPSASEPTFEDDWGNWPSASSKKKIELPLPECEHPASEPAFEDDWNNCWSISSKKKKDKKNKKNNQELSSLIIPGNDFGSPIPTDECPPPQEFEPEPVPEPEPMPKSSSSSGSWEMPNSSYDG